MHSSVPLLNLLGICHCRIFDEGKIVGNIFVIRQPTMSSNNTVQTCCYLKKFDEKVDETQRIFSACLDANRACIKSSRGFLKTYHKGYAPLPKQTNQ